MHLMYKSARKASNKGPYLHLFKGRMYRFELGEVVEVDDEVGHDVLAKVGDIIFKAEKPKPVTKRRPKAVSKKKAAAAPKTKILEDVKAEK